MTKEMKMLAFQLLTENCYLMPRKSHTGRSRYMLYKDKQVPVRYVNDAAYKKFSDMLKVDGAGRMTFNLSLVRQQHGKNYVKKLYKNLKTTI